MAFAFFLVTLLTLPARALLVRMKVREAQELPWRKAAVASAVLGHTFSGSVAVGLPENQIGKTDNAKGHPNGDAYDRVQAMLVDAFGGRGSPDVTAIGKLLNDLRGNTILGAESERQDFLHTLEESLSSAHAQRRKPQTTRDEDGEQTMEMFVVTQGGGPVITIGRYPASQHRTPSEVSALQDLLEGAERSHSGEGLFMRFFAQSHTSEEFAKDTGAEVLVIFDAPIGTLHSLLAVASLDYKELMTVFFRVYIAVQRMNLQKITHRSDITPDTVYVTGDIRNPDTFRVVFSPVLLCSDPQSAGNMVDVLQSDIRQFGSLLRFILSRNFSPVVQHRVDVFLAFGKALESGALSDEGAAGNELVRLMEFMDSPATTPQMMMGKRIDYLKQVVDAEVVMESDPVGA